MSRTIEILGRTPPKSAGNLTLYLCGRENCAPGHSFGPAIRPHYLFHYIFSGTGTFFAGGRSYALSGGQGFLITPGDSTVYTADGDDPWHYCWFGFDGSDALAILRTCGLSVETPIFTAPDPDAVETALRRLLDAAAGGAPNEYAVIGHLYLVFAAMKQRGQASSRAPSYCDDAAAFIRHNYAYDIRISDIARHVGIDRTYLFKLFSAKYGISPQGYLIRCRLTAARDLLLTTDMDVSQIARSCGFGDLPSFYKQFGKAYGMTPIACRRSAGT